MKKGKDKFDLVYVVIIIVAAILLLCSLFFKEQIYEIKKDNSSVMIDDMEYNKSYSDDSMCGIIETYSFNLPQELVGENSVLVYTKHQNVRIYCGDTLVYSLKADPANFFGKTPGCQWSQYSLDDNEVGQKIRIELDSVYKSAIGKKPIVLLGSEYNCFKYLVHMDGVEWILSIITILSGIFMLLGFLFWYCTKKILSDKWIMGFLAITVGMWKWGDLWLTSFLIRNSLFLSLVPIFSISMVGIPMIIFILKFLDINNARIWNIPIIVSFIGLIVCGVLQIFNIADFKQTLVINHITLAITILFLFHIFLYGLKHYEINKKSKFAMLCIVMCILGSGIDLFNYYKDQNLDSLRWDMVCFLIYLITMFFYSVVDINQLIKKGEEVGYYREIAYKDALTGAASRVCFYEDLEKYFSVDDNWIFVTCDLNNLKKINDTLGHEAGDVYIKAGAGLIMDSFKNVGKCYRIGGDEFWILVQNSTEEVCNNCINKIEKGIYEIAELRSLNCDIGVACGYASFDKSQDREYSETMRRADKAMYVRKMQLKSGGC